MQIFYNKELLAPRRFLMSVRSTHPPTTALRFLAVGIIVVLLFAALSVWAGIPSHVPPGLFALGAGFFFTSILLFGLAFWHLMVRPLPGGQAAQETLPFPAAYRKLIAALAAI